MQALGLKLCPFCGSFHLGLCRRVSEIEYYPEGGIKRALLKDRWDQRATTWPWEIEKDG